MVFRDEEVRIAISAPYPQVYTSHLARPLAEVLVARQFDSFTVPSSIFRSQVLDHRWGLFECDGDLSRFEDFHVYV